MSTTWINRGHFYVPHVQPILVDCNFLVSATDTAGLGITSLKGQGVSNVFMHTSATPGRGSNGVLNPNPAAGYIWVQLADNFQRYYGQIHTIRSPLSGSDLAVGASALTAGVVYVISVLGTTTAAEWLAVGVPPGVVPALNVAFTAIATGAGSGSGKVQLAATAGSGIDHLEVVGDPNTTIGPIPVGGSPNVGGWVALRCMGKTLTMASYTPAGTVAAPVLTMDSYTPAGINNSSTPPVFTGTPAVLTGTNSAPVFSGTPATLTGTSTDVIATPAAGTWISLAFYLSQSSVKVAGE